MSLETAKITFYQVDSCGYYSRGEQEPRFGTLESTLNQLYQWGEGKQLAETKTFETAEGATELPAYLFSLAREANGWLLTTWNETESSKGQTASVLGTSNVGNPEVAMRDLPEGGIPGFATYFWIIPSRSLLATIRFQHRLAGKKAMQNYLESYLATCSDHVAYDVCAEGTDIQVAGYQEHQHAPVHQLTPRFSASACRIPSQLDTIRQRVRDIRKVIKKTTLNLNRPEELAHWQRIRDFFSLTQRPHRPDEVRVKHELNTPANQQDLDLIIRDWEDNSLNRNWDDYGFVFKGESQPVWLSDSIAKGEFELNIERDNTEVVNAESLLAELSRRSEEICRLLDA